MAKKASIFETNTLKKGAWSEEEDEKLRAYIQRYGHWNWSLLPKFAGLSRSGKSCRLRWMNYLRPNMKHGNFTKEEDDNIVNLHKKLGNKWSAIAANLPGRSDNEIKNRWNIHLKRRAKEDQNVFENNHDENIKFDQAPSCSSGSEPSSWGLSDLDYAMSSDIMLKDTDYEHTDDFWMEPFMTDITSPVDNTLSWSLVDDFISQYS